MSQLQLAIYPNFEQSGVQLSEWRALLDDAANTSIFLTPEFLLTALEQIPYRTEKAKTLVIRSQTNKQLLGLFFFRNTWTKWKLLHFNMVEYTVVDEVDQPYPIIHRDYESEIWQLVLDYFYQHKSEWDLFDFMELPPASPLPEVIASSFKLPLFTYRQKPDTKGPVIDLAQSWDNFAAQHKKMRKKMRKMARDYGDDFEFKFYNGADYETHLNQYIELEQKSWKGKYKIGISKSEIITHFYQHLFKRLAQQKSLFFGFIYIKGKLVSGEIAYAYKDTIYFSHGSFDPAYQKYSPGMVSTALFIKKLCGQQYRRGDFLTGFASYINPWAKEFTETQRLTVFKLTPRMIFVLLLVAVKKGIWRFLGK